MNGNKGEERGGHGLCCSNGAKPVYLGIILFIIGLMLQNQKSIPEIIMIIGAFILITGLISFFSQKNK